MRDSITIRAALALSAVFLAQSEAQAAAKLAGTLFVVQSKYTGSPHSVRIGQALPNTNGATAITNGTYPTVFNNDTVDGNFGITSPIIVTGQQANFTKTGVSVGRKIATLDVTKLTGVVTSFSSKSELSLHLSTDNSALTLSGYEAPINVLDVSNTNTPDSIDPTNSDTQVPAYRAEVELDFGGAASVTNTDAYSGNNGRGAILARNVNGSGLDEFLLVSNAGNGSGTEPTNIVNDTGVQAVAPGAGPATTVIGAQQGNPGDKYGFQYGFAVQNIGDTADKSGKDDNFRGSTVFNNQLYVSKGSGSNGVNTVYQVTAPNGGLPLLTDGPNTQISILPGFPTGLASNIVEGDANTEFYPFDMFFADANTLYVADEGPGDLTTDPNAGLQKWVFDGTKWNLAYVIQAGLNLGQPYAVTDYPQAYNPATTGLRHITGLVNNGQVTIFATTATASSLGDPGADPNQVVEITDPLAATSLPANEAFSTVSAPKALFVYRGVAFYPGLATLPGTP